LWNKATTKDVRMTIMKYANLSPTAQAVANASDARDIAMRNAYEAEGTERETAMDVAYKVANDVYESAKMIHRAALEGSRPAR
jgi:hypothetical protein